MAEKEPSPLLGGRIADARGRKVTQLDPVALYLLRRHDWIDADALRAIAHGKGVRITGKERVSLIGGVVALLAVTGLFFFSIFIKQDFGDAPFARTSFLICFCFMPWLAWYIIKRLRFEKVTEAMIKHLCCPHCGYDLRMLPTDPKDQVAVCPECGCAWRLDGSRTHGDHETVGGLE